MKSQKLRAAAGALVAIISSTSLARAEWPALPRAMELAKSRSLAVREATGQVAVASSYQTWAHLPSVTNPYLEVQTSKGPTTRDIAVNSFVMVPIEVNGQRSARIDEADAMLRWRSFSRDDVRSRSAGEAVALWGLTLTAVARVDQYAKVEADARTEIEYYVARLAAADSTVLEKSLAEAELARYAQLRAEATVELLSTRSLLEAALGVPVDLPTTPSAEPPSLAAVSPDAFVRRAVDGSPARKALTQESSFWAAQSSRVARDANVPLNLIVNFSRTDLGDFQVGGGLAWSFPIFIRNQGAVAHAEAQRARTLDVEAALEPQLASRARSLYEQYSVARAALDVVDATGIPAFERVVDFTQQGYKAGKTEYLHVLQARRDRALAYARRFELLGTLWRKYGEMVALLGELP